VKALSIDILVKDAVKKKYGISNYVLVDCTNKNKKFSGIGNISNEIPTVYYCGTALKNYSMGNVFAVEIIVTMNLKEVEFILGKN